MCRVSGTHRRSGVQRFERVGLHSGHPRVGAVAVPARTPSRRMPRHARQPDLRAVCPHVLERVCSSRVEVSGRRSTRSVTSRIVGTTAPGRRKRSPVAQLCRKVRTVRKLPPKYDPNCSHSPRPRDYPMWTQARSQTGNRRCRRTTRCRSRATTLRPLKIQTAVGLPDRPTLERRSAQYGVSAARSTKGGARYSDTALVRRVGTTGFEPATP